MGYFSTDLYTTKRLEPIGCKFLDGHNGLREQMKIKAKTGYLFGGQKNSADCLIRAIEFIAKLLDGHPVDAFDWVNIKDLRFNKR